MVTESNNTESEERATPRHRRVVTLSAIEPGETRLARPQRKPPKECSIGEQHRQSPEAEMDRHAGKPTALLSGCRENQRSLRGGRGASLVKADPSRTRTQRPHHSPVPAQASHTRSAASASPRLRAGGPPGGSERVSHHAPGPPGGPPLHPPTKQAQAHRSTQVPARSDSPSEARSACRAQRPCRITHTNPQITDQPNPATSPRVAATTRQPPGEGFSEPRPPCGVCPVTFPRNHRVEQGAVALPT